MPVLRKQSPAFRPGLRACVQLFLRHGVHLLCFCGLLIECAPLMDIFVFCDLSSEFPH